MDRTVADIRKDYTLQELNEHEVDPNPVIQFQKWFDQACSIDIPEPNAMTIATVDSEGKPSARMVLLKDYGEQGFVFYTNYNSRKGQELTANPHAAIVFWWAQLERQVRITGSVEKISDRESDEYFYSRPFGSRLGAWTSNQSEIISSREVLEQRLQELQAKYQDSDVPRPSHWGGFRVIPAEIEFWQGRSSRLHDRILYTLCENSSWKIQRLSP